MGDRIKVALFGASGRTGQVVAGAAAAQGLMIRASVRDAARAISPSTIEILRGDLGDADHLRNTIAGTMAVCCVFGPRSPYTDVFCARATELIMDEMRRAGVRRLVCQTGAMIGGEAVNRSLPVRLMVRMFQWQRPAVAADRMRQEKLVRESELEWTIVKPPRLTDGPARGRVAADVDLRIGLSSKISRADLARFLVGECVEPHYLRQAVYVSG